MLFEKINYYSNYMFAGITLLLSLLMFSGLVSAQTADIQNSTCQGANLKITTGPDGTECQFEGENTTEKFNKLLSQIVNLFSAIVGIVAVLMIIYGGFRYILSGGDSANVTNAKNTILYAIIGLIIVALAQFIVKFVLSRAITFAV